MKFKLLIIICLIYSAINAQDDKYKKIKELDSLITSNKRLDENSLLKNTSNRKEVKRNARLEIRSCGDELCKLISLEDPTLNPDTLLYSLEFIHNYESVYELYSILKTEIENKEEAFAIGNVVGNKTYIGGLKRNLKVVEGHLEHLLNYEYCQYSYINTSRKIIKGVYLNVDNDVFYLPQNQDRNYSGGLRFEITTDYLKMRVFPFINNDKILAYQGIFYGMKAYTPNMEDTSIFNTNTSFDINDRPFASFSYIGRSKYRMHYKGFMRMRSDFKIGVIGGKVGNELQSIIHRDQTVSTRKPYGWDSQIANGGRFAWNIDHYYDLMLLSQNSLFGKMPNFPSWINIPLNAQVHFGNELTAFDAGIGFSNLGFKERSGNEDIKLGAKQKVRLLLSANVRYRRVIHNSMLEGIGLIETFEDDDDPLAPTDMYRLEANEVERDLFFAELFVGIRIMKATAFYKYTYYTKEYHKPNALDSYYWASVGLNFLF